MQSDPKRSIMVHIAMIEHADRFLIVFPLAQLGDLHKLLYNRENPYTKDRALYDLTPSIDRDLAEFQAHLLLQSSRIADALHWLHDELFIPASPNSYCAHMDLKPDNILISKDRDSLVGSWAISDFGISVIDAATGKADTGVQGSGQAVRPMLSRANTMKARAQRDSGTYQAPEVRLTPNEVGRRSDVWSWTCIFFEILVFALGGSASDGANQVEKFYESRKGVQTKGEFYSTHEKPHSSGTRVVDVNPEVLNWQKKLLQRVGEHPGHWVECCVGILRKHMVVDASIRPNSQELKDDLSHAHRHFRNRASKPESGCKILNASKSLMLPFTESDPRPRIATESSGPPSESRPRIRVQSSESNRASSIGDDSDKSVSSGASPVADPFPLEDFSPSLRSIASPDLLPPLGSKSSQCKTSLWSVTRKERIVDLSIWCEGESSAVTYLMEKSIKIYSFPTGGEPLTLKASSSLADCSKGWSRVSMAGSTIAIWGYSESQKKRLVSGCSSSWASVSDPL